ncbi:MAG: helix-turn-helix domain-containing protein [Deltaproteobacteria bacterium]|jgi:transcriptional regulator with XRE-family HTH domain|nr:helix-turn-helix domain-containing protein [Deltaproteobacteria bacterium]
MLAVSLKTPKEFRQELAARAKERRLALNISQQELAEHSGVSLGSIKRFESSGLISLSSLLEIALVFDCLGDFDSIFSTKDTPTSLFEPEPKKRKRSSRKTS